MLKRRDAMAARTRKRGFNCFAIVVAPSGYDAIVIGVHHKHSWAPAIQFDNIPKAKLRLTGISILVGLRDKGNIVPTE
jgi:hypothetical protein